MSQAPGGGVRKGTRLDIQGLRAVAVIVVLVFHAGLPLPGGFVGVDMFFVISGFVITLMLLRERARSGRINLGQFYLRRFKRLTPALGVTVAVTAVLGLLFLSPMGQQQLGLATGLGALFLVANAVIHVWSGDYFAPHAEANPLLHVWSLSVEEQFYLMFPALLVVSFAVAARAPKKWGRAVPFAVASLVGLASLATIRGIPFVAAGSFWTGYYSPVNRAWEFLAGVVLALVASRIAIRSRLWTNVVALAGVALVAASLVVITPETPFPGKATLLPVAGTALLIWAGLGADNVVTRTLSVRPMVIIGDWSYSLYLWHWPFVVVAKAIWPFSAVAPVVATVASVGAAWASYRFVETPLRTMELPTAKVILVRLAQVIGIPLVVLGLCFGGLMWTRAAMVDGPLASRYGPEPWGPSESLSMQACPWPELAEISRGAGICAVGDATRPPDVMLIGDSHAEDILSSFQHALPRANVGAVSARVPHLFYGPEGVEAVATALSSPTGPSVVIYSRQLDRRPEGMFDHEQAAMRLLAERLTAAGKTFFVLDDRATFPDDAFRCVYRTALVLPWPDCTGPRAVFDARHALVAAQVDEALRGIPGAARVQTFDAFCDESRCRRGDDTVALYTDGDHLGGAARTMFVAYALRDSQPLAAAVSQWR